MIHRLLQNHIQGVENAWDAAKNGQYNIDPEGAINLAILHVHSKGSKKKSHDYLQNLVVHETISFFLNLGKYVGTGSEIVIPEWLLRNVDLQDLLASAIAGHDLDVIDACFGDRNFEFISRCNGLAIRELVGAKVFGFGFGIQGFAIIYHQLFVMVMVLVLPPQAVNIRLRLKISAMLMNYLLFILFSMLNMNFMGTGKISAHGFAPFLAGVFKIECILVLTPG